MLQKSYQNLLNQYQREPPYNISAKPARATKNPIAIYIAAHLSSGYRLQTNIVVEICVEVIIVVDLVSHKKSSLIFGRQGGRIYLLLDLVVRVE
jgi:hypothetical protein